MLKLEKTQVFGWESAIRGMRNPMNSWDKSDSFLGCGESYTYPHCGESCCDSCDWILGQNDLKLMKSLSKAGSDHAKFLRMINVTVDITAPLYWWKEFDTYKVGTVANSCSTMHKIHSKEFTVDDFSFERTIPICSWFITSVLNVLNTAREHFLATNDKRHWDTMIQFLPSSYNQKRTVQLNYQVLKSMYFARKNHKLDEWRTFCDWIVELPYFMEVCVEQ